ncbi:Alpha-galactosidase [Dactylella cylindrospora]|nr:Alpha-galactosidase [Dactylella cylindrospora]
MKITSYPPLSGTTVVDEDEVEVVVCLDLSPEEFQFLGNGEIQCAVWHDNGYTDEWTEQVMESVDAADVDVFSLNPHPTLHFKTIIRAPLSGDPLSFTINYIFPSHPTTKKWVNQEFEATDGVIIFRSVARPPFMEDAFLAEEVEIHNYFSPPPPQEGLISMQWMPKLTKETAASDPKTWVYNFNIPAQRSPGYGPGVFEGIIGIPIPGTIVSYFATIKHGTAWVQPNHSPRGRRYDGFRPPKECVLVAFQLASGDVVVFLPMSTAEYTVYLKGDSEGRIVAVGRNDVGSVKEGRVVCVLGRDVEEAVEEAFYWVRKIGRERDLGVGQTEEEKEGEGEVEVQAEETWNDALKYCTWNSLGRELTDRRVVNAVNDLYDSGIKVETIIIDDNWQSLDGNGRDTFGHRWTEFEADKHAFPNGLKGLVDDIKRSNPGVKHVAVWHGILGYWNGVSPSGWIARNYRLRNVGNGSIYVVDKSDIGRLYDDFYRFLSNNGITAVKADTQCLLDERLPSWDKGDLFPAYLAAWRTAASKYFGTRAISCMSLVPQILFTNHLYPTLPKFTLRNSDDFFPHTPNSHPWHIFANAHNAIFTSRLNVTADWDMFQTKHDWAGYHAAARCLSGGPVYITDDVGSHDISIVKKVVAKGRNGEQVTLRPDVGKSEEYFVGFNEGRPVKISSSAGPDDYKIKLIGTFDLDGGRERTDMVSLRQVLGGATDGEYAVYSHNSKTAKMVTATSYVKTVVQKAGWDTMSISPIVTVKTDRGDVRVAVFGLLEQISGAAAVKSVKFIDAGSTIKVGVELKALGVFGLFTNYQDPSRYGRIRQVTVGGVEVPERFVYVGEGESYGHIKVDLEAAWDYLRLDSRWDINLWVHLAV